MASSSAPRAEGGDDGTPSLAGISLADLGSMGRAGSSSLPDMDASQSVVAASVDGDTSVMRVKLKLGNRAKVVRIHLTPLTAAACVHGADDYSGPMAATTSSSASATAIRPTMRSLVERARDAFDLSQVTEVRLCFRDGSGDEMELQTDEEVVDMLDAFRADPSVTRVVVVRPAPTSEAVGDPWGGGGLGNGTDGDAKATAAVKSAAKVGAWSAVLFMLLVLLLCLAVVTGAARPDPTATAAIVVMYGVHARVRAPRAFPPALVRGQGSGVHVARPVCRLGWTAPAHGRPPARFPHPRAAPRCAPLRHAPARPLPRNRLLLGASLRTAAPQAGRPGRPRPHGDGRGLRGPVHVGNGHSPHRHAGRGQGGGARAPARASEPAARPASRPADTALRGLETRHALVGPVGGHPEPSRHRRRHVQHGRQGGCRTRRWATRRDRPP